MRVNRDNLDVFYLMSMSANIFNNQFSIVQKYFLSSGDLSNNQQTLIRDLMGEIYETYQTNQTNIGLQPVSGEVFDLSPNNSFEHS